MTGETKQADAIPENCKEERSATVSEIVAAAAANPFEKNAANSARTIPATFVRAEGEDDDGYDPWSDRVEESPMFEENPWR
ncbi:MAG: hypothetical protein IJH04_02100 [Eggerthellaceae bacterium]|nr:hypothetical protein [Eggerthellaceae bacterium]